MDFLLKFIWLDRMLEYLIKSSLVLILALLLVYLCRRRSASLKHFILSVSLIGLMIFPLLSIVQTGWKTKLLPYWSIDKPSFSTSHIAVLNQSRKPATYADDTREKTQVLGNKNKTRQTAFQNQESQLRNLMKYSLLVIWLSGLSLILARQIFGLYGAYKLTKEGELLKSSFWSHLLKRLVKTVSVKKKVDLFQHKKVKVPLTWGWLKPVVIMPVSLKSWSAEQRESALYHELSHVKRADFLVLMLACISMAFFWFNPLSWVTFRLMKKEQEKACDELVLKTGIKPSTYAANLLSIRSSIRMPWNPPAAVVGAIGGSQLNERLLAILKNKFNLEEVKMRTKVFLIVMLFLTITFLGMARPNTPNKDFERSNSGDVLLPEEAQSEIKVQEEDTKKKDQEKTDKKKDEEKKKDVFVWQMDEGEEGEVEVIITSKGKVKSFTIKEPVIIIKKDDSGKEIVISPEGDTVDIKKDKEGNWVAKGDIKILHEDMEEIALDEDSVITLKTRTKDGHKTIEIDAPAVIVKKTGDSSKSVTIKVKDEGDEKKAIFVSPHVVLEKSDIDLQVKEAELKKIHEKLQKIHERLSEKMESKTEEEEQALDEMEETLNTMKAKLDEMENKLTDITLSIKEEPHKVRLKHGHSIYIERKTGIEEGENYVYITRDKGHILSFINEKGEATYLLHMRLEKSQKQAFVDAVQEIEQKLPEGYELESEFDEESGKSTIKIKGGTKSEDNKDIVIGLLEELKEKLAIED